MDGFLYFLAGANASLVAVHVIHGNAKGVLTNTVGCLVALLAAVAL